MALLAMGHVYWKRGMQNNHAVFEMFFRKNPFKGQYTVLGGISEALAFVRNFRFTDEDVEDIRDMAPEFEEGYLEYLKTVTTENITVYAVKEGSLVFPKTPLIRAEGPLIVCQFLETTLLTLCGYASLVATKASRMRLAAGFDKQILEFGLRRAQGPDGGISATRYSYLGSVDGTSNVKAKRLFNIPVKGTMAHSLVTSFTKDDNGNVGSIVINEINIKERALQYLSENNWQEANEQELDSFIAFAESFPDGFLALIDTYDSIQSGVPNFLAVALALNDAGHHARGIRLDSGDLAYISRMAREMFQQTGQTYGLDFFAKMIIVASNDIDEEVINSMNIQGHEIDVFGIGTNLVTCKSQPALGMVYKLVQLNGQPRIKLSEDVSKMIIPSSKDVYRLYNKDDVPFIDLMVTASDTDLEVGSEIMCHHPIEMKRTRALPTRIERLLNPIWKDNSAATLDTLDQCRERCIRQLKGFRPDHLRHSNPTPYMVSVTEEVRDTIKRTWETEAIVKTIS